MVEKIGKVGYDWGACAAAWVGDRQAPGIGRTSAAGKKPGAFFTSGSSLFYDSAVGMASAMLVSHAGSWRTLSHRRHPDRQARGDGSSFHGRVVMSDLKFSKFTFGQKPEDFGGQGCSGWRS